MDISSDHRADYDKEIEEARKDISPAQQQQLLAAKTEDQLEAAPARLVAPRVLRIALAYLYSGRPDQARQTIREMWPAFDQENVWTRIQQTRQRGILKYTRRKSR